jgi:hypothetical protein
MRKLLVVCVTALIAALGAAAPSMATMQGHEVSKVNPYAGCPIGGPGVLYPNTEPEPWVARNPANPDNFIGVWQQDRWDNGGARGLSAGYSFNDGHFWQDVPLPFSKCAAPFYSPQPCPVGVGSPTPCTLLYDRASDAWVDIGPDGKAYTVSISFNANDNNNAVGAAVSADGGATWRLGSEIVHDIDADPLFPFNDKEAVTADPTQPNTAYVVWDRLALRGCGPAGRSHEDPESEDRPWRGEKKLAPKGAKRSAPRSAGAETPPEELLCFEGPATFSATFNGGLTWTPPRPIVENAPDEQTIGNQIVVDPKSGRLYDVYLYFNNQGDAFVEDIFSDDKGVTWSPRQTVDKLGAVGIRDPQTGAPARTGDILPEPAIDPRSGQLYVVWQDARFNHNDEDDVVISTSPPMTGTTGSWTPPQRVNLPRDRAGFTPAVKVNALGQVGVDYYSLRHPDLGPDVWPVERYLRISSGPGAITSGPQGPAATFDFNEPTHVAGPFNMLMAPFAGGYFTGDYEGMAIDRHGKSFHTFFAQPNCDTTNCPPAAVDVGESGFPAGAEASASRQHDPFDVYTNNYYKLGSPGR